MNLSYRWGMLFTYPANFTPVSLSELGILGSQMYKFSDRNVKCIALSCDPMSSHFMWIEDIRMWSSVPLGGGCLSGLGFPHPGDCPFPIISDPDRDIVGQLGLLNLMDRDDEGKPLPARAVSLLLSYRGACNPMYIHNACILCLLGQLCTKN